MADLATLQARLAEAEAAYHKLMTGSLRERIGMGDMQMTYTRATAPELAAYIAQLRGDVVAVGGDIGDASPRRAFVVDL